MPIQPVLSNAGNILAQAGSNIARSINEERDKKENLRRYEEGKVEDVRRYEENVAKQVEREQYDRDSIAIQSLMRAGLSESDTANISEFAAMITDISSKNPSILNLANVGIESLRSHRDNIDAQNSVWDRIDSLRNSYRGVSETRDFDSILNRTESVISDAIRLRDVDATKYAEGLYSNYKLGKTVGEMLNLFDDAKKEGFQIMQTDLGKSAELVLNNANEMYDSGDYEGAYKALQTVSTFVEREVDNQRQEKSLKQAEERQAFREQQSIEKQIATAKKLDDKERVAEYKRINGEVRTNVNDYLTSAKQIFSSNIKDSEDFTANINQIGVTEDPVDKKEAISNLIYRALDKVSATGIFRKDTFSGEYSYINKLMKDVDNIEDTQLKQKTINRIVNAIAGNPDMVIKNLKGLSGKDASEVKSALSGLFSAYNKIKELEQIRQQLLPVSEEEQNQTKKPEPNPKPGSSPADTAIDPFANP